VDTRDTSTPCACRARDRSGGKGGNSPQAPFSLRPHQRVTSLSRHPRARDPTRVAAGTTALSTPLRPANDALARWMATKRGETRRCAPRRGAGGGGGGSGGGRTERARALLVHGDGVGADRATAGGGSQTGGSERARARGAEGARAAGRSRASLPSARSARYAISLTGHVCVTLTFTLVPFGVLGYRADGVAAAAVTVRRRVVRGAEKRLYTAGARLPEVESVHGRSWSRARTSKQCSRRRGRREDAERSLSLPSRHVDRRGIYRR